MALTISREEGDQGKMRTIIKATLVECDECGVEELVQSVVGEEVEIYAIFVLIFPFSRNGESEND